MVWDESPAYATKTPEREFVSLWKPDICNNETCSESTHDVYSKLVVLLCLFLVSIYNFNHVFKTDHEIRNVTPHCDGFNGNVRFSVDRSTASIFFSP